MPLRSRQMSSEEQMIFRSTTFVFCCSFPRSSLGSVFQVPSGPHTSLTNIKSPDNLFILLSFSSSREDLSIVSCDYRPSVHKWYHTIELAVKRSRIARVKRLMAMRCFCTSASRYLLTPRDIPEVSAVLRTSSPLVST